MKCAFLASAILGAMIIVGCGSSTSGNGQDVNRTPVLEIQTPVQTDDGWETAPPEDVGLTPQPLIDAVNAIRHGTYNEIHGLVIVKDGKLILEEYGRGRMYDGSPDDMFTPVMDFDRDTPHILHSVSKSVLSTLVGIAVRDGFISSEDESVLTFFPEHANPVEPEKERILLKHLMTMSSGLEWNEWDVPTMDFENNDALLYQRAVDPSAYFFSKDLIHEPGTVFYYNTAGFQMIGEVIRRTTGMDVGEYAAQTLFTPLGMQYFEWPQFPRGPTFIVGDILLRPRDMAKFGQLVLQGGRWNGRQVVPSGWLETTTADFISVAHTGYKGFQAYGFHWWHKNFRVGTSDVLAICADGLAGQAIMVFPSLDLVLVITSGNYDRPEREHDLVSNHILQALIDPI